MSKRDLNKMAVVLFWICLIAAIADRIVAEGESNEFCEDHSQCPDNNRCLAHACVNPCSYLSCQGNTKCRTKDHEATCVPGKRQKQYVIPDDAIKGNWFSAVSQCNARGMRLASVLNEEENNELKNVTQERLTRHFQFEEGGVFWLAGMDALNDGTWRWMTSGDLVNYTDWHPGGGGYGKEPFTHANRAYPFLTAGFLDHEQDVRFGWFAQDREFTTTFVCEYFV